MDQREYSDAAEFAADIRVIFANCYKYNPEGHDVVQMARKLEEVFETRFKSCPPDQDRFELSPVKHGSASAITSHGRMPQGLQRMPQSQVMNRSFQAKQQQKQLQQQPANATSHLAHENIKKDMLDEDSESELDRDKRLEDWNGRLLQVC